jgi:hypothetical protein
MAESRDAIDALQLLLQVAYLQSELYSRALADPAFVPASDAAVVGTLSQQEVAHVSTLSALIAERGGVVATRPAFDFTANGAIPGFAFAVDQYATFTMLAQAAEDLGVRAYKGQLSAFVTDLPALVDVLAIHSVEGRHASEVRRLRGRKGWITGDSRDDLPAVLQPVYDGEANVIAGTIDASAVASAVGGAATASEALDEPLDATPAGAIVALFVV